MCISYLILYLLTIITPDVTICLDGVIALNSEILSNLVI